MIGIVDYGVGNIRAFLNIFKELGVDATLVSTKDQVKNASKLILPGVGHFDFAMTNLQNSGLIPVLEEQVLAKKIRVLGVCVGMQMLAKNSAEGSVNGLGWIPATVKKIETGLPLPHMGWNNLKIKKQSPIFKNIDQNPDFYFLHSYALDCENEDDILAEADYGINFPAVVQKNNVFGMQCHPEKSHGAGIFFLKNFAEL